ncbi:caspase family protein [Andreprevotia chitinilytica]|uniref:caspase family protein n=1 Tax=Andreprevotia chitinilytica TaxID=396808 RepID=UPI000557D8C7|nr:caspase family protein [Andreprevotia chitinilytica]
MKYKLLGLTVALAASALLPAAYAEERALVVGVGKYQMKGNDLPGIDLDVAMAKKILKLQGFRDDQIRVLQDEQATAANIKAGIKDWLGGASSNERAVFYFSGHGSRIPSANGEESVLVANDAHGAVVDGRASLAGVVSSADFMAQLKGLKSQHVYAIVDACHSGGMSTDKAVKLGTRNIGGEVDAVAKFLVYPGMPAPALETEHKGTLRGVIVTQDDVPGGAHLNYVAMLAAGAKEYALATSQGSAFTLAVSNALDAAVQDKKAASPKDLTQAAGTFIHNNFAVNQVHTPELHGDTTLKAASLMFTAPAADGENWHTLAELARRLQPLALTATQSSYAIGERVKYELNLPREGYLNIVTIDANDQATVLFPNPFYKGSNFVKAGKLNLPVDIGGFRFEAADPKGKTLTVAFLSSQKLNLLDYSIGQRDRDGKWIANQLGALSAAGVGRAVRVVGEGNADLAGVVQFTVK